MIKVQVRPNEPLEAALRRFKRQCNYAGIFRLAKKYAYYEKRSDKRRREDRERIRNIQRAMRKMVDRGRGRGRRKSKVRTGSPRDDSSDSTESVDATDTSERSVSDARSGGKRSAPLAAARTGADGGHSDD
jgi:small subunit ribosomal protein S21